MLTTDNMGMPLEFYHKMERLPSIHQNYAQYRGVKPLRIDHFNCFSPDVDSSVAFYNEMGFRVTEYTEDDDSKRLWRPGCIAAGCMTWPLPMAQAAFASYCLLGANPSEYY